ncbi:MAG: tyrosine-type recombinase/integrase [Thermoguttaceae bacterium]|nr:tyrosine-type recombinase/integrase [Thermoguttaceae bacterium]
MPKLHNRPPKLCLKKSNQTGFVNVDGRQIYMGKWGSEADAKYRAFIAEWASCNVPACRSQTSSQKITLAELFSAYVLHPQNAEHLNEADMLRAKLVIRTILSIYPTTFVDDFGPLQLEAVRDYFFREGYTRGNKRGKYSRGYLNKLVNAIRSIFAWGVSRLLVKRDTYETLKYLKPLLEGHCSAPETTKRDNAEDKDIIPVLPYLLPMYRTMIELLCITAMRPSELCRMRACDIDRSRDDGIWLYTPSTHKTKAKGKQRIVALGVHSQKLLVPILASKTCGIEYLFTPEQARREQWERQRAKRKSMITPSQLKRDAKRIRTRFLNLNDHVQVASLSRAVSRGIKLAQKDGLQITAWTPYCIRHKAITDMALVEGPVASQRIAGHSNLNTTNIYNHAALQEAITLAKKYG